MPRPVAAQKTRRVDVESSDVPITTGVHAPSFVRGRSDAGEAASALSDALGVTSRIYEAETERRNKKSFLEGTRAAVEGREPTPEELKRDAFTVGFERVRMERSLVDTRRAVEEAYSEFDKANGTPDELNETIDRVFAEQYEGLDPEDDIDQKLMDGIAASLEQIRGEVVTRYADDLQQQAVDQVEGDLLVIARDDFANDGAVDYSALHERLIETVGGTRGNELFVSILSDIAINNGQPDVIENMPAKWADGTPTPRNIKRFSATLRNARVQAESQRAHSERLAEAAQVEELKLRSQQAEAAVMLDVLEGREITGRVSDLLQDNILTPETARTLLNFQGSQADDFSAGEVNDSVSATLEIGLYTGDATITDVIEAASNGSLGNGRALKDEASRLMRLAGSVQTVEEQRLDTPSAKRYQSEIKSLLTPKKDAFGNPDPIELQTQAEALRVYSEKVSAGAAPAEARNEVLEAAARRRQAAKQVQQDAAQDSPQELLELLSSGAITEAEFDRRMSALEASL